MEVGEISLNISPEPTYLGVLLDQNLTLKAHILTKAKRASYHLYRIRQIVKFLDLPAKKTTYFIPGYVPIRLCQCYLC